MSDLKDELKDSIDEAVWEWLSPHADRDAVILVANSLNLVDVGFAIANDQASSVNGWISGAHCPALRSNSGTICLSSLGSSKLGFSSTDPVLPVATHSAALPPSRTAFAIGSCV
jgi:hypothetical protein